MQITVRRTKRRKTVTSMKARNHAKLVSNLADVELLEFNADTVSIAFACSYLICLQVCSAAIFVLAAISSEVTSGWLT